VKKYLIIASLFISIIGVITSFVKNDILFEISFLWVLIENIKNFPSNHDQDEEE